MPLNNIIFDFDGVLADTADVNFSISQSLHPEITDEDFRAHHDGNVYESPRIPFNELTTPAYHAEYERQVGRTHLQNALGPVLFLAERFTLCIVSSTSERVIQGILEKAEIDDKFARVMGVETHPSKVEKFKMLMIENGVTTENAVFVTDTLGDVREAHKVGFRTIAETFGFHDRARLAQGEPYAIVDSWNEIVAEIEKLARD